MEDFDLLMQDLASAQGAGQRNPMDRYREFRQVFLGSDAGKRVLHDILSRGRIYRPSTHPGDPYKTHTNEGKRELALEILMILHREPAAERPQAGRSKPKE